MTNIHQTTLYDLLSAALGPPVPRAGASNERHWWRCPFHPDNNPSFCIITRRTPTDRERWNCFGCGKHGDAIDFLRLRNPSLTFPAAKRQLAAFASCGRLPAAPVGTAAGRTPRVPRTPRFSGGAFFVDPKPAPAQPWQAKKRKYVGQCKRRLWSRRGEQALDWLRQRGLADETIRQARLGYDGQEDAIVIPWFDGRTLRMVNLRRLSGEPKYEAVPGSVRGVPYPTRPLAAPKPILVVEGELDALLAGQEFGDLVSVMTLGSASDRLTVKISTILVAARNVLLAFDADPAGDAAARRWQEFLPRARRLRPPEGQDLTDLHASIGLCKWLKKELGRHGKGARR